MCAIVAQDRHKNRARFRAVARLVNSRYGRRMRHPDSVAQLLRPRPAWKSERGSTDNDAAGFEDACFMLAGAGPLPSAAFLWRHNGCTASRRVLEPHLAALVARFRLPDGLEPDALVQLALDEQHAAQAQRRDDLRALVLGVPLTTWRRHYQRAHAVLLGELDSLAGDCWRIARDRLGEAA